MRESNRKKGGNIYLNIIIYSSKKNRREINEKKIYFYSYKSEECRLLYQVDKKEDGFFVVERNKNQPILI